VVLVLRLARLAMAWLPLTLIIAVGVAVSIDASVLSARYGEARARAEFERRADGEIAALKISIDTALGAVTSLAALFEARGTVERSEFKRFAETILGSNASIQALEWAKVVPHDQRASVEAQLTAEFGFGVHFTQHTDHDSMTVAGERARYVPVMYFTPMRGNLPALAYDLASEPTRRAAVEQAERTGQPVASGRIVPVQLANEYSFLLLRPIFDATERPRHMTGLVLGLFRIRDIVAAAMAEREGSRVRLLLLDRSAPEAEQVLYPRDPDSRLADLLAAPGVASDVVVGGRVWRIVILPAGDHQVPGLWESRLVLAGGLLLTGNVALYVLLIMRRRRAIEREVHIRTEEAKAAMDHMRQGLCRFDAHGRLVVANQRFAALFGLQADEIRPGLTLPALLAPATARGRLDGAAAAFVCEHMQALTEAHVPANATWEPSSGFALAVLYQPMDDAGWLVTLEDVSERQVAEARIAHMAHHDALTDLANRTLFRARLQQALAGIEPGQQVGLLYLDLDEFKSVNDTMGHPTGDRLLQAVTLRLLGRVRETDTVARLGGDEFAVLLPQITRLEDAASLAGRLIEAIHEPFDIDGVQITVGTSIGIALAPQDGSDPDELLRHGDLALYRAKLDGRGVYRAFRPEMDAAIRARRALETDLRQALALGQLSVEYQPLVDLLHCTVSGFEALVRWNHPVRGAIPPSEFIPLAEETGLIEAIGEFVLRQACEAAMSWPQEIGIAVNLSPVQLRSPRLLAATEATLRSTGLAPRRLELEVTETAILQDTEANLTALTALRRLGVHFALDDFGTGYSSLSYLRRFPFDRLKIDRSFVRELERSDDCLAIIRAICGLALQLGLATTAEGVETEVQLAAVAAAGCNEGQGYLFSQPVPASAILAFLARLLTRAETLRRACLETLPPAEAAA
jgi:diguanylate cyclase (GGDEF)-like protein